MQPLAIVASGMVTGVGLTAAASCAAIRCAIDNFAETRFMDKGGEWIIGSQVPLERPWRGLQRLVRMAVPAIQECLTQAGSVGAASIPLLLGVAERERPGRIDGLDDQLFRQLQVELGVEFDRRSAIVPHGRIAGATALGHARHLLYQENVPLCLIAGVDSFIVAGTMAEFEKRNRLLTSHNSNGFIPGEGAAAILVGRPGVSRPQLLCIGMGSARETVTIESEEPLRGDGLVQAIRNAMTDSGRPLASTDYRITDSNGEQYWFKEAALAVTRTLRDRKEEFFIWHAADCIGETGAAAGLVGLGVALTAARKDYAPGPGVLCHFGSDDGVRIALLLNYGAGSPA